MSKILLALATFVLALVAFHSQANAETVSATAWAKAWVKNLEDKKTRTFDTEDVEKSIVAKCVDCDSKANLKNARKLFAKGDFDAALSAYNSIPRGEANWLAAVEEKGWAYFRKEDYEKTLSQTKTLLSPQFGEIVNSEAYLLQSLTQLKMCDYKGVFETHTKFKEKQKSRVMEIQNLAKTGWNDGLATVIAKADKFPMKLEDMTDSVQKLPLLTYKDVEFQKQLFRYKASLKAMAALDGRHDKVVASLQKINAKSLEALKNRLQEIASAETENNFKVIQKLNLVEVEAIHRVHTDLELSQSLFKKGNFKNVDDDQLVFMDDGLPWIDELDKFEVAGKVCAKGIRRKM
ncbi:hypothetical protein ACES2L_06850 [Bdellovibrio bacteriovorus]